VIPGALVSALFVVGILPGYLYLSWTRGLRESRSPDSPLESLLEVVGVGLATTGMTILVGAWLRADELSGLARRLEDPHWTGPLIRDLARTTLVVLVVSVGLAAVGALGIRAMRPKRYYPRIWQEVFAERKGEFTWVRIDLVSGKSFAGALHGSDFAVADGERDVVLRSPIREIVSPGQSETVEADRLVISESDIALIRVHYQPHNRAVRFRWIEGLLKHLR
jgi:hypothetical protein